jgi:hypothetical protein
MEVPGWVQLPEGAAARGFCPAPPRLGQLHPHARPRGVQGPVSLLHRELSVHFFPTILSGTGAPGECATFDVWVEAFEAELLLFFFLKKCEYPMVLSDLEIPPDLKILLNLVLTKFSKY